MTRSFFAPWAGVLLIALLLSSGQALALYQAGGEEYGVSISAAVNAGLGLAVNPNDFIYAERHDELWNGDLRLLADGFAGKQLRGWLNILQNVRSAQPFRRTGGIAPAEVERSSLFSWQQQDGDSTRADLVLDAGYGAWGTGNNELIVGRQPVQLSVTTTFTPNDFFASFAPQQFYRLYKPGVDAIRFEHRLADLTQLSLVGVLGYSEDPGSANGWSREPLWRRTSLLGRYTRSAVGLEWGALAGVVRENTIVGASLQGELTDWLGLRAEGHYRDSHQNNVSSGFMLNAGLEHRFASSLAVRLEQMYNSTGYSSLAEADRALANGTLAAGYLGQLYSALDLGYEFSPLLTGELLFLRNWTDASQSFSFYAVYSLADESELALRVTLPEGRAPDAQSMGSELGMQPVRIVLEYRHYF